MTAYLAGLSALSPAFAALQVLALLADTDIRGALAGGYWVVGGGWLLMQWAERGRTGQGLGAVGRHRDGGRGHRRADRGGAGDLARRPARPGRAIALPRQQQ